MERSTTQIPCPYFLNVLMKMVDFNCTDEEGGVTYTTGSNPSETNVPESLDKQWKKDGEIYNTDPMSLIF